MAAVQGRKGIRGLDNTPDLPPFTSRFDCVIIFIIQKPAIKRRYFPQQENSRLFFAQGVKDLALMKYCNKSGCNHLIPQGEKYCAFHTVDKTTENRERYKEYDAHCRDKKAKEFYNSLEWKTVRAKVIARDAGIDVYLYVMEDRIVPADTVHHIVELMEDYSKRCDIDNLISISEATHNMISKAYKDTTKKIAMQQTLRECARKFKYRFEEFFKEGVQKSF